MGPIYYLSKCSNISSVVGRGGGSFISQYTVKAQTSLAPLSWFHGSHVTTAQCACAPMLYISELCKDCRHGWNWLWNWLCVNLHPWQRTRDHGVRRLTLTAYNWRVYFQNLINPLLVKIELLTSLCRITLELVTEWNLDPDNSRKYSFFSFLNVVFP